MISEGKWRSVNLMVMMLEVMNVEEDHNLPFQIATKLKKAFENQRLFSLMNWRRDRDLNPISRPLKSVKSLNFNNLNIEKPSHC